MFDKSIGIGSASFLEMIAYLRNIKVSENSNNYFGQARSFNNSEGWLLKSTELTRL